MSHRNSAYAPAALAALVIALAMVSVLGAVGDARQQAPQAPAPAGQTGRGQARQPQQQQPQQPTRDTSAQGQQQQQAAVAGTGRITGRVLTADTGRPVRGARVTLSAAQLPGGRNMVTDASGLFDFTALPESRYNLSVSKTGFVTLAYGQRRPLQPGTPLQLASGQRLEGIELRLPRGSAIAGHVFDENGDPLPNTMVRVMRYQYQQGERRLTPAGSGQTDDKGQYRVWGLNPGDYYVSAVMPNLGNLLDQLGGGRGAGGRGGQGGPGGPGAPGGPAGPGGRGAAGQATDPNQAGAGGRGGGGAGGAGPAGRAAGGGQGAIAGLGQGGAAGIRGLIGGVLSGPGLGDALAAAGLPNVATMFGSPLDGSAEAVAYAATYYPGVSSPAEARPITVGLGAEALDIDFNLLLVKTSRISGRITNPDGTAVSNGNVTLSLDESSGRGGGGGPAGGAFGESFASRTQTDGSFSIANVPPGRYTVRARSNPGGAGGRGGRGGGGGRGAAARGAGAAAGAADPALPQFASQPLTVGGDITDLVIALAPGATLSGAVALQIAQTGQPPNLTQVRVTAQATDSALGTNINAQVAEDGTFTLQGVPGGTHWIRAQAPRGLMLKAVTIGGRDVIDEPYEVRSGETIDNVSLIFTDKVSEINGTITDDRGTAVTDYTVLAYPEDSRLWRPQARQIMTSRPDQNGKFQIRGLPPGRYYVATVDPAVAGEWFEPAFLEQHRDTAARLSLIEGEVKTQDFKMR